MQMKYYYKRNLPHFVVQGYSYFVTARLANSLPANIINKLREEYKSNVKVITSYRNKKKKREKYEQLKWTYFKKFDIMLEKSEKSPHWLKNTAIAKIVKESLHYRDGKDWNLIAYTIMSNHIHMVFWPYFEKIRKESSYKNYYPLGSIMGSFKKYTGARANKLLNRTGAFWQAENYNHIIRNYEELHKIVQYVLNNPVQAGYTDTLDKYRWNYYNPKFI